MSSPEHRDVEPQTTRRFSIIQGGQHPGSESDPADAACADAATESVPVAVGGGSVVDGRVAGHHDDDPPSVDAVEGVDGVDGDDRGPGRHGPSGAAGVDDPDGAVGDDGVVDDDGDGRVPDATAVTGDGGRTSEDEGDYVEARDAIAEQARAVLEDADPVVYYRSLRSLVRESHSSLLGPLDYSADLPFHDPTQVVVPVAVSNVDTALLYARAAFPDFDEVILAAFTDPARADLLVALYDLLFIEGRNIALVTNHGQIIDIALVVAALFVAMSEEGREFGVLGDTVTVEEMGQRCNTLVSRMVTTRQAFGLPALHVTHHVTRVFLSLPQTASRRRAKIDPALVRANNALMRYELENQLANGGQLLAMAASGSQDLTIPQLMSKARAAWRSRRGDDPGEEPTLHLQPLYNGTMSLMRSCDYVLPVAVSLDSRCPAVVVGSLTRLREDDDCHRVMDWIALAHQEATGIPTIYHQPGDDLLTQVRGLINR